MNFEKIGLILFIKYLKQIDIIKDHLLGSVRELLLASSSVVRLTAQITSENTIIRSFTPVEGIFNRLNSILESSALLLSKKGSLSSPDSDSIRQSVVESIIATIEDEIEDIQCSSSKNQALKIEALLTVKTVLMGHVQSQNQIDASGNVLAILENRRMK